MQDRLVDGNLPRAVADWTTLVFLNTTRPSRKSPRPIHHHHHVPLPQRVQDCVARLSRRKDEKYVPKPRLVPSIHHGQRPSGLLRRRRRGRSLLPRREIPAVLTATGLGPDGRMALERLQPVHGVELR